MSLHTSALTPYKHADLFPAVITQSNSITVGHRTHWHTLRWCIKYWHLCTPGMSEMMLSSWSRQKQLNLEVDLSLIYTSVSIFPLEQKRKKPPTTQAYIICTPPSPAPCSVQNSFPFFSLTSSQLLAWTNKPKNLIGCWIHQSGTLGSTHSPSFKSTAPFCWNPPLSSPCRHHREKSPWAWVLHPSA